MPGAFPTSPHGLVLATVILAAGASTRMGRPKLLLEWEHTTVLGHLVGLWQGSGAAQITVVCAADDDALATECDRLGVPAEARIINPEPARGMFSSIQCAARWAGWWADVTHWAIALGDQPHLQPDTLCALVDFASQQPGAICQPGRDGSGRHPVILPRPAWCELAGSTVATLREFLHERAAEVRLLASDDPGLDLDLNQPGDYVRARSSLEAARGHRQ